MTAGIILGKNSPQSKEIFKMQNKIIWVMKGCGNKGLCGGPSKRLNILPLKFQYVSYLVMFMVNN
jgi:hypothetical protein